MKNCSECDGKMDKKSAKTPEGVNYSYYKCLKCGYEVVDMKQLHLLAETYREMKRYNAKISKWGLSLGIRIPKELVKRYNLRNEREVIMIPEKEGIRVIPG